MTSQQMYTIFSVAILRKFNTTQELTPGKWTGLHQLQTGPLPFKKNNTNLKRKKNIPFTSPFIFFQVVDLFNQGLEGTIFCNLAKPWRVPTIRFPPAVAAVGFSPFLQGFWLVSLGTFPMTTNVTAMQCHPWVPKDSGRTRGAPTLKFVVYLTIYSFLQCGIIFKEL